MCWRNKKVEQKKTFSLFSHSLTHSCARETCRERLKLICHQTLVSVKQNLLNKIVCSGAGFPLLQMERLEKTEHIRSFHTQRRDLFFHDKALNHHRLQALLFLSSSPSLLLSTIILICWNGNDGHQILTLFGTLFGRWATCSILKTVCRAG